jgi:HEAT repeat protein
VSAAFGGALAIVNAATAALFATALLFAATTVLLRWRNARVAARWSRLEAAWTPLLVEALAGDRSREEVAAAVAPADALRFADFLVRFARRLRGAELEVVRQLAEPLLPLVARRLSAGSAERRARAVQTLSLLGPGPFGPSLIRALEDPSPLVALVAARALASRRQPAHTAAILAHLHRFERWSPHYLASMLAGMGPHAAPPLRIMLADAAQPALTRAVAAEALRMLKDLAAADVAAAVLPATADREVLAACLRLVAALGRAEHLDRIRPLLASGDDVVRAAATAVLAQLGGAGDTSALRHGVGDPSPWVAMEAARGLRRIGALAVLDEVAASGLPGAAVARQVRWEAAA